MIRSEVEYGKFRILAGQLSGIWTARAFLKSSSAPRGIVKQADGQSLEDAIENLKKALDETMHQRREQRRYDEQLGFPVPIKQEYVEALQSVRLTDSQLAMLKAHAKAGEAGMTATDLASAGGYSDHSTANLHYGKAGRALGEFMDAAPPDATSRNADLPTGILATVGKTAANGEFVWEMHPELRSAVEDTLA